MWTDMSTCSSPNSNTMVYGMSRNSDGLFRAQNAPVTISATNPMASSMGTAIPLCCLRRACITVTLSQKRHRVGKNEETCTGVMCMNCKQGIKNIIPCETKTFAAYEASQ